MFLSFLDVRASCAYINLPILIPSQDSIQAFSGEGKSPPGLAETMISSARAAFSAASLAVVDSSSKANDHQLTSNSHFAQ